MKHTPEYWAANVAGTRDADLLRFIAEIEARLERYQVALAAALEEAIRRSLIEKEATSEAASSSTWEET
jgi:hypothetical protein